VLGIDHCDSGPVFQNQTDDHYYCALVEKSNRGFKDSHPIAKQIRQTQLRSGPRESNEKSNVLKAYQKSDQAMLGSRGGLSLHVLFAPLNDPSITTLSIQCQAMIVACINNEFVRLFQSLKLCYQWQWLCRRIRSPIRASMQNQEISPISVSLPNSEG